MAFLSFNMKAYTSIFASLIYLILNVILVLLLYALEAIKLLFTTY